MEPQRTLTDLPFEVLDLIYKALAFKPRYQYWPKYTVYCYSKDKLNLAETCEYLGQAFAYHSRQVYKMVMYDSCYTYIPKREYSVIVSLCGLTAVEYVGSPGCHWSAEVAQAVGQYCPNLQRVRFQVYFDNGEILLSILHKAKNSIRTLKFGYESSRPSRMGAPIMHKMPDMPFLGNLTVDRCYNEEAYEIQRFLNIEELYLCSVYTLREDPKPLNLFKVCAPLKKLRLLTVVCINITSDTDEDEAIPEFPALESIKLCSCMISMEFPSCPKLKILDIGYSKCHIEGLICRSVLKQGKDLERLIVESRPSQFDNDSFLEVVRKFRKLRHFDVPIRKMKFDMGFVTEVVNILRENGVTKEDPLELELDEVSKIHWLHHWLSYIPDANLIKTRVY